MDKGNFFDENTRISCSVLTCAYNKNLHCTAEHIFVGTEYADDVTDTVCVSYRHVTEPDQAD